MTRLLFLVLCLSTSLNANIYFAEDTSAYSIEVLVFADVGDDNDNEFFDIPAVQHELESLTLPSGYSSLPNAGFATSQPRQSYTIRAPPEFSRYFS